MSATVASAPLKPPWPGCLGVATPVWDTLVGHRCGTLFSKALVGHYCVQLLYTLLYDALVGLVGHFCGTPLSDPLVQNSCQTLFWDTLVRHSCPTLLWPPLVEDGSLVGHSRLTLGWGTLVGHSGPPPRAIPDATPFQQCCGQQFW